MGLFGIIKHILGKEEPAVQKVDPAAGTEKVPVQVEESHPSVEIQLEVSETAPAQTAESGTAVEPESPGESCPDFAADVYGKNEKQPITEANSDTAPEAEPSKAEDRHDTENSEDEFPEWLLDDSQIPPEEENYSEDELPFDWEPAAQIYEAPKESAEPKINAPSHAPQVFVGSQNKTVDFLCVIRRHFDGLTLTYCRSAASAAYLRDALAANGQQALCCCAAEDKFVIREAAAKNIPLLAADTSALDMQGIKPACVVFFEMPESLQDYQEKLTLASVPENFEAVYAFYTPADYVVARHQIMNSTSDSADLGRRLDELDELRTWFTANGTPAKELSRKITAETSTEQVISSCSGLVFVITGKVYKFEDRSAVARYIVAHGGKFADSLTKSTHYLITNDTSSGSKKNQKAAQYGTKIISEDEFIRMFCGGKVPENDNN